MLEEIKTNVVSEIFLPPEKVKNMKHFMVPKMANPTTSKYNSQLKNELNNLFSD